MTWQEIFHDLQRRGGVQFPDNPARFNWTIFGISVIIGIVVLVLSGVLTGVLSVYISYSIISAAVEKG